jgi:hypothetical protein
VLTTRGFERLDGLADLQKAVAEEMLLFRFVAKRSRTFFVNRDDQRAVAAVRTAEGRFRLVIVLEDQLVPSTSFRRNRNR